MKSPNTRHVKQSERGIKTQRHKGTKKFGNQGSGPWLPNFFVPLCLCGLTATRNRRQNRNRVPIPDFRVQFLFVADVVLIDKDIDKPLHVLAILEYTLAKSLELRIQRAQNLADGSALDFHFGLTGGYWSQRRRNLYGNTAHFESPVIKGSS